MIFSITGEPKGKTAKQFFDYLRNDYASTAIAPFSLRAREGGPVDVPLSWEELNTIDSSSAFNILNINKKLNETTEELTQEFLTSRQQLRI